MDSIRYATVFDKKRQLKYFLQLKLKEKSLGEGPLGTQSPVEGAGRQEQSSSHHIRSPYPSTGNTFFISHSFSHHVRQGENRHSCLLLIFLGHLVLKQS